MTILCNPPVNVNGIVPLWFADIFVPLSILYVALSKSVSVMLYCNEMSLSYVFPFSGAMKVITGAAFTGVVIVLVNVVSLTNLK